MEERFLQYIRVTNNSKLADRYLTVQVKQPADPGKNNLGKIFVLLEITSPDVNNYQIGQTLINTFAIEYLKDNHSIYLIGFEEALKIINQLLSHFYQTAENDWYKKFNALFILSVQDQIHAAAVGNVNAWLIRNELISRVFDKIEKPPSPNKIFNFVISGNLELGDGLILTSSGWTEFISTSVLKKQLVDNKNLADLSLSLAKILLNRGAKWVNFLALKVDSSEQDFPSVIHLDSQSLTSWQHQAASIFKFTHHKITWLGSRFKMLDNKTDLLARSKLVPGLRRVKVGIKNFAYEGIRLIKTKLPLIQSSPINIFHQRLAVLRGSDRETNQEPKKENLIGKNIYNINNYLEPNYQNPMETVEQDSLPRSLEGKVNYYKQADMRFRAFLDRLKPGEKTTALIAGISSSRIWRSNQLGFKLVIFILLTLLIINIRSIINQQSERKSLANSTALLVQLEDKLEEAKLSRTLNQIDKSLESLGFIVNKAKELENSKFTLEVKQILNDAQVELDRLTATTRFNNLSPLVIRDSANNLALGNNKLLLASQNNLAVIDSLGQPVPKPIEFPTEQNIVDLAYFDKKDSLMIFSNKPTLYELGTDTTKLQELNPTSNSWRDGVAIAQYFNNIYILSPSDNQIWKYPSQNGILAQAQPYVSDGSGVNEAIDLTIDGNVFVLLSSGQVLKFGRGAKIPFELTDIPKPFDKLSDPKKIFASTNNDDLYILDGTRIVITDKNGKFKRQLAFDLDPIADFVIDETNKKLYLASSGKIYQIGL